jgi:PPM family protein phosphatase
MSPLSYKPPSIHLAWLCDKGLLRTVNEDALLVRSRSSALSEGYETGTYDVELSSDPLFLGVAHGCGGVDHEEYIGKDILRYIANGVFSTGSQRMYVELQASIQAANRYQNDESKRRAGRRAIGATLAAALVDDRQAALAQVGDTRCYRHRDGKLEQGGRDQTLVEQLISAGQITAEEASRHRVTAEEARHRAYSAVGLTPEVLVNTSMFGLRNKDWLLLCTNGIWKPIRDDLIEEIIRGADSPLEVVTRLKSRATEYGGTDSLSIIAAQVSIP